MAIATYKDLCIDAVDQALLASFWAGTLGLEPERLDNGSFRLNGATPRHRVWINGVPEPVTVKQRVHLDVHAGAVEEVLSRGASAEDLESFRWKVLRDPEGGELCVFEREDPPAYRLYEIGVDAADPRSIARWWVEVLGATFGEEEEHGLAWADKIPGAPFDSVVFARVPEPKTVKNRIHWDVDTADVSLLTDAGATVLRPQDDGIGWTVMADPEGNEFCAFVGDQDD